jgi:hypothetical protein
LLLRRNWRLLLLIVALDERGDGCSDFVSWRRRDSLRDCGRCNAIDLRNELNVIRRRRCHLIDWLFYGFFFKIIFCFLKEKKESTDENRHVFLFILEMLFLFFFNSLIFTFFSLV